PLGSGLTLLSIYHGLEEMYRNNIIVRFPKLVGVETCGNPIYSSSLGSITKCSEEPLPGLAYKRPIIMDEVINILEEYGETITVSKSDVLEAAKNLARKEGLFVEPSAAVALAGSLKTNIEDYTVILLTGHGLKGPSPYTEARRIKTNIFPGSTKSIILNIIKHNPGLTGYEIWKMLGIKISVQAVYQHLHDLEKKGLIRSEAVDGLKRYYLANK
ncbi:MAG: pyridoxal-phosphate dependent enzyme, partial [Staphylothermus sp.]|nr:pyridoxal-phosphate dependent enzyme [Staphylothermus sp.]